METLVYFAFVVVIATAVALIGGIGDGIVILFGRTMTRAKKWLWNIAEMLIVFGGIIAIGIDDGFHWFHIVIACANSWFIWRIIHDGVIGGIIAGDFLYLGKGAWDSKMLAAYQNSKWLYFILNKCFPLALLIAWFFNY